MKLYLWTTPNGYKPLIMLEEVKEALNSDFELVKIRIDGEQKEAKYLSLNPNGRIPTLVDDDLVVFESGAILLYLAEKTGLFLPKDVKARYNVIQWLMFQMGGVGPMFGQANHFSKFADEKIPYAINRYQTEVKRLYSVVELGLEKKDYIAGDYSIADISLFTWMRKPDFYDLSFENYPKIEKWIKKIAGRPAVKLAMSVKFIP